MNSELIKYFNDRKKIIVITGPTASGKTDVSIELSKLIPIEVISADSRQIYKYLNIGTATPSKEELKQVKTHFINILKPDEYYSAGIFAKQATKKIFKIFKKGLLPVVVGGTGFYIKALFEGLFEDNIPFERKEEIRIKLNKQLKDKGIDYLFNKLQRYDKESALLYPDKNYRRIIRALEFIELTGQKYSEHRKNVTKSDLTPIYFAIDIDRNELYERINKRVIKMWNNGLITETKRVLSLGYSKDLNSLNTVGYKETIAYIEKKIDQDEAIKLIQKNTRHYAKRQLTWLRRVSGIKWIKGQSSEIVEKIFKILNDTIK